MVPKGRAVVSRRQQIKGVVMRTAEQNEQKPAEQTQKPEATTQTVVVTKQQAAVDSLKKAVEAAGKTFEDKGMNGKKHLVSVNGVDVAVGAGGGFDIPAVSTYPKADLATMVKADELFAKQTARRTKLDEAKKEAEKPAETKDAPKPEAVPAAA